MTLEMQVTKADVQKAISLITSSTTKTNLHNQLNLLPYLENIEEYNYLEKRKRIIEDILLIRYEKAI